MAQQNEKQPKAKTGLARCLELASGHKGLVPMFITTLSQTRMKSRFLAADEYISPKKSNSVGAS